MHEPLPVTAAARALHERAPTFQARPLALGCSEQNTLVHNYTDPLHVAMVTTHVGVVPDGLVAATQAQQQS